MALREDINAAIAKANQSGYTAGGSAAANGINRQYQQQLLSGLTQLQSKYGSAEDTLSQQLGGAQNEGQDTLNQNAVTEQVDLRRILEQMANYGATNGGQLAGLNSQADATRQNSDNAVYSQRSADINSINDQLAQDESTGETDLQNLQAQTEQNRQNSLNALSSSGSSTPSLADVEKLIKGNGPNAAIHIIVSAYGAGTKQADSALADIGYQGLSFDEDGNPHILGTLADYATYGLNGGYMYDQNGNGHYITTINEYTQAKQKGYKTYPEVQGGS